MLFCQAQYTADQITNKQIKVFSPPEKNQMLEKGKINVMVQTESMLKCKRQTLFTSFRILKYAKAFWIPMFSFVIVNDRIGRPHQCRILQLNVD